MSGAMLIPEFDHEFGETRRSLERLSEDHFDWKPHDKSFSVHELAAHLAEIPHWVPVTLQMDEFDLDAPYERVVPRTKAEILERFDEGVTAARALIGAATADDLAGNWSMKQGGEVTLSMPKAAVLRSFILNHNVHHRAQLGVYLRMLGIAVPGHYGPTADER